MNRDFDNMNNRYKKDINKYCTIGDNYPIFIYSNNSIESEIRVHKVKSRKFSLFTVIILRNETIETSFNRIMFISGLVFEKCSTYSIYTKEYLCLIDRIDECDKLLDVLNSLYKGWMYDRELVEEFFNDNMCTL